MLGNFSYYNPTRLYFGEESLNYLKDELKTYGPVVMLNYGSGSVKRNGIYDQVVAVLKESGKRIVENPGVMSNPTLEKLNEGVKIARDGSVDLILALGGGSVCDYSKAVAASVYCDGDYWEKYWLNQEDPAEGQRILPVGCILTMAGTGSEMNAGSVITDAAHTFKVGHVFDSRLMPKFSILNPRFTMSVPEEQMKAGIYDIMNHIMEQYFSDYDDNTSDYISEGLMRSLIVASRVAVKDPKNYEARSNIMWTATWALNTLVGCGKQQDWMVHMIGHSVGAWTHAPHGYCLAAVSLPYYRRAMKGGLPKFVRFAKNVWNISGEGLTDEQTAEAGLKALEDWMKEIGLPRSIRETGATEEMIDGITEGTILYPAGYLDLKADDVKEILRESLEYSSHETNSRH
jgi:alcohol dehydrogenase YqhD (iron-dependent ADH family)